jgi:hypothetical protein
LRTSHLAIGEEDMRLSQTSPKRVDGQVMCLAVIRVSPLRRKSKPYENETKTTSSKQKDSRNSCQLDPILAHSFEHRMHKWRKSMIFRSQCSCFTSTTFLKIVKYQIHLRTVNKSTPMIIRCNGNPCKQLHPCATTALTC